MEGSIRAAARRASADGRPRRCGVFVGAGRGNAATPASDPVHGADQARYDPVRTVSRRPAAQADGPRTTDRRQEPQEIAMSAVLNTESDEALVKVRRDEGIVTLTMNRGAQYNALSSEMMSALQAELDAVATDPGARVVILAAGGKAFCAGHDRREKRSQPTMEFYQKLFAQCSRLMLTIQRMPQPVIARVHGIATAAGCQLVAMCDLAVAVEEAKFAVSGVNLGLFCSTPSVALSRNLSRKAAFEMLVTGDFIDAATALDKGLINRVVPAADLDAEVDRLARKILAKPSAAIAMGKGLFYRQLETGIEAAYQLAGQTMACNMMEDTAQEGVQAFIDKRSPSWKR
jgi:enoyl-CoA hydratase/carnithine racemase